jgi:hypothetical protein
MGKRGKKQNKEKTIYRLSLNKPHRITKKEQRWLK